MPSSREDVYSLPMPDVLLLMRLLGLKMRAVLAVGEPRGVQVKRMRGPYKCPRINGIVWWNYVPVFVKPVILIQTTLGATEIFFPPNVLDNCYITN